MIHSTETWSKGDDYDPEPGTDMYIAGINVGRHGNAIHCYGSNAGEAAIRRDFLLASVNMMMAHIALHAD